MVKRKGKKNKRGNKKNKTKLNSSLEVSKEHENKVEAIDDDENDQLTLNNAAVKRRHEDDDSDVEEKPRKKKKKKPIVTETTDKKGKKSIRQTKRENYLKRQAQAAELSKNELKSQCLSYLSQWKHDKQNWKFMKVKQLWLLKNKFCTNLVPNEHWQTLLEYFESAKGNIRTLLLDDAKKVIQQMDEWTEKHGQTNKMPKENEDEENSDEESSKPNEVTYKRARDLLQCLEE